MTPFFKFILASFLALAAVGTMISSAKAADPEVCVFAANVAARASLVYATRDEAEADAESKQFLERIKDEYKSRIQAAIAFGKANQGRHPQDVGQRYFDVCVTEKDI